MFKSKCIQHRYLIAFFLFLIAFYGYNIQRVYGFTFFPDEFGYWAYAAKAIGYDWSDIVSLGSYYSYGYSLILFPILKFCKNAVMAYRTAVTVNFILLGIDAVLLNYLVGKLMPEDSELKDCLPFLTGIALFYPPILFYAKTSMVETTLMSTFLLITYLLYLYLENNRLPVMAFLLVAIVYIHFLHMRAVGVAIAALLTLIVYFFRNSKKVKHFILAAVLCGILALIGFGAKTWLQNMMYANTDTGTIHINDYAGQLEKIRYIFTKEGIVDFACGLCGKVLYLGLSSFGLVYFGMARCLKKIKNRQKTTDLIYLFLLLSILAEIMINTIYNIRPFRVDSVVYGRYDEFVLPVLMILGALELSECRKTGIKISLIIFAQSLMTYLAIYEIDRYHIINMHGYVMVGMSYLYDVFAYTTKNFFWSTFIFESILLIIVAVIIRTAGKKKLPFLMTAVILMEFLLFARASQLYLDSSGLGAFRDTVMTEKIEQLQQREENRRIIYLQENDDAFISSIQFLMPEEKIEIVPAKENVQDYTLDEMDENDLILISYNSSYGEKLEELYQNSMLEGRFKLYYN